MLLEILTSIQEVRKLCSCLSDISSEWICCGICRNTW